MRLRTRGLPLRLMVLCILLLAPLLSTLRPAPAPAAASSTNAIEDTFTRANQTGWGTSTNNDGVPNVAWGLDGDGTMSYVTISNDAGVFGYPGSTEAIGLAAAGSTTTTGATRWSSSR